jgi:hypothetical protein
MNFKKMTKLQGKQNSFTARMTVEQVTSVNK